MHHSSWRPGLPSGAIGTTLTSLHHYNFWFWHVGVCHAGLRWNFLLQGHLLSCTLHCLLWLQKIPQSASFNADDSDDEGEEGGCQSELQMIFESMTRRMIKSELEDFELVDH